MPRLRFLPAQKECSQPGPPDGGAGGSLPGISYASGYTAHLTGASNTLASQVSATQPSWSTAADTSQLPSSQQPAAASSGYSAMHPDRSAAPSSNPQPAQLAQLPTSAGVAAAAAGGAFELFLVPLLKYLWIAHS